MSSRQFYIMLCIGVLSMKMQKLPCLIYGELGKDGYLLFLTNLLINLLLICLVFFVLKKLKSEKFDLPNGKRKFSFFKKILMFLAAIYFLSQALLVYEHIQALFANTLFDNLSWALFSLLLLFAVFFLSHRGIENIALSYEIYFWLIIISFVLIAFLGAGYTDFSAILPLKTIDFPKVIKNIPRFSFWFGDAILVFILGFKSKEIKLSKTMLIYSLTMIFMSVMVVEFYGMFGEYSVVQSGLVSVLSSQALLGLNIGRIDWFLILFVEMGAILTCSVYLFYSNECLKFALPKVQEFTLSLIVIAILYLADVFYFKDMSVKISFFQGWASWICFGLQILILISLLIASWVQKEKIQPNENKKLKKGLGR